MRAHSIPFLTALLLLHAATLHAVEVSGEHVNPNKEFGKDAAYTLSGDTTFGWMTGAQAGNIDLAGHKLIVETGGGNRTVFSGSIMGPGTIEWRGGSVPQVAPSILSGDKPNYFKGTFTLLNGVLDLEKPAGTDAIGGDLVIGVKDSALVRLGHSNQINDAANVTFGGAGISELELQGHDEKFASLTLQAHALIAMGNTPASLLVGNSGTHAWNLTKTMTIRGFKPGQDKLIFGTDDKGLNPAQLARIGFESPAGMPAGLYTALIDSAGQLAPGVIVNAINPPFDVSPQAITERAKVYAVPGLAKLSGNDSALRDETTIAFFGDSITWQNGFISLIQKSLGSGDGTKGKRIKLINRGINGGGVLQLRDGAKDGGFPGSSAQEPFAKLIASDNAGVAVVFIGINDVWWRKTTPEMFEQGLRDLVAAAAENKTVLVLATMTIRGELPDGKNGDDNKIEQFCELTRKVARETDTTLVDLRKAYVAYLQNNNAQLRVDGTLYFKPNGVLTYDGVHPTAKGNELLANLIGDGVQRALLGPKGTSAPAANAAADAAPVVGIVPWPQQLTLQTGVMKLDASTVMLTSDASLEPLAAILSDEIFLASGRKLAVSKAPAQGAASIMLKLDPALAKGAYTLKITPGGAELRGGSYAAAAMGGATLLQALQQAGESVTLPAMALEDRPQSEYDGIMVDVARRANSIEALKQCVMLCHLYKIRYFHLHLSDDQGFTFPSTIYPALGSKNGGMDARGAPIRYALDELKDLVHFADARGVTLVPEMEMPGHSGALSRALPELFGVKDSKTGKHRTVDVLNLANEAIYPALDTLVGEICDVFHSSPYFHIGGDECYWHNFEQTDEYREVMKRKGFKTTGDLFADFLNRMNEIVKKHGRQTICWEGFNPSRNVDKDIIVMAWGGGHEALVKRGNRIINVPWVPQVYSTPRENYEWTIFHVGPEGRKPAPMPKSEKVIGAQMVLWERPGDEALRLLRATAPARHERIYHPDAARSYEDFERRLQSADRLVDRLIVPVKIAAEGLRKLEGAPEVRNEAALQIGGNILFSDALTITLEAALALPGESIRYTLDGSDPTPASKLYSGPFKITEKETRHWQPNVNYVPISEATLKARLFIGDAPAGFTSLARYQYDYIGKMPKRVKFSLFEAPPELKKFPENLTGLKLLFSDLEPWIDMRAMPHVRLPEHKACLWEGAAVFEKEGDYEFQLRSFAGTSQLFVDGNLVVDRTETDWGETQSKLHLSAGDHAVMVTFCGKSDFMTIRFRAAGEQRFAPLQFKELSAESLKKN